MEIITNKTDTPKPKKGGENGLGKWVKAMISSSTHKELKRLAINKDVSLGRLLQEAIKNLLTKQKEKENGKG